eukprot:gene23746-biopygen19358
MRPELLDFGLVGVEPKQTRARQVRLAPVTKANSPTPRQALIPTDSGSPMTYCTEGPPPNYRIPNLDIRAQLPIRPRASGHAFSTRPFPMRHRKSRQKGVGVGPLARAADSAQKYVHDSSAVSVPLGHWAVRRQLVVSTAGSTPFTARYRVWAGSAHSPPPPWLGWMERRRTRAGSGPDTRGSVVSPLSRAVHLRRKRLVVARRVEPPALPAMEQR